MMKMHFAHIGLPVMLLVLALSSCSNLGQDQPKEEFRFGAVLEAMSTKSIFQNNVFPDDSTFTVLAIYQQSASTPTSQWQLYFAADVEKVDTYWKSPTQRYYWPLDGAMRFRAFTPTATDLAAWGLCSSITPYSEFNNYVTFTDYTIKHRTAAGTVITEDSEKSEANLKNAEVDFCMASNYYPDVTQRTVGDPVPMVFAHNLSQMQFKAQALEDYSNSKVEGEYTIENHVQIWIDKIQFNDIYSVGTYSTVAATGWNNHRELYNYVLYNRNAAEGTKILYKYNGGDPADNDSDHLHFGERTPYATPIMDTDSKVLQKLFIPQTLNSAATLQVTYTIRQTSTMEKAGLPRTVVTDYTSSVTKEVSLPAINNIWTLNKCYTYLLKIGLYDIEIDVEYSDWKSGSTSEAVI